LEKRSLYEMIFGKPKQYTNQTQLKMLNGFTPIFTNFSGRAYDSDVVRGAIDAIARNAAKLKPKHIRRKEDGIFHEHSQIEKLLAQRPNPHMDSYTFLYKVVTQLYLNNNSFIYIDSQFGQPVGFYPINFSTVELMERDKKTYIKFNFQGGQVVTLPYEEVIHLRRFFNEHDIFGDSSYNALIPTLELINTANQGIINAVKSSAFLRGLLKFTSMLKPEDMKKQRDIFVKDYMDINNNGGIAATDSKADYVDLKSDPKMIDSKTMELIERKVYKYYNVNENIVMSKYSEEEWNAFYESVLEPIAIQMSLEFTSKIFTEREMGHGNEIIFEANRLQYASNTTKISLVNTLMDRGLLSLNEGREVFNLAPIEGGEKRIVSLNYVDASKANEYQLGESEKNGENDRTETEG